MDISAIAIFVEPLATSAYPWVAIVALSFLRQARLPQTLGKVVAASLWASRLKRGGASHKQVLHFLQSSATRSLVEPQAEVSYVKMLTPPGPTKRPTTMRTTPHRNCLRTSAKIPEITRMTAIIHNTVAMIFTFSRRESYSDRTKVY